MHKFKKRTLSQPDNMSEPDGQCVLEDKSSELVCQERRDKVFLLSGMAKTEEMEEELSEECWKGRHHQLGEVYHLGRGGQA